MSLFRRKKQVVVEEPLEQRLDIISELTKGLGKKEFNALIEAVKGMYNVRQSLKNVKTEDEKEYGEIDDAERKLELEVSK